MSHTLTITCPKCGETISELKDSSLSAPKKVRNRHPCAVCDQKRVERFEKKHGLKVISRGIPAHHSKRHYQGGKNDPTIRY